MRPKGASRKDNMATLTRLVRLPPPRTAVPRPRRCHPAAPSSYSHGRVFHIQRPWGNGARNDFDRISVRRWAASCEQAAKVVVQRGVCAVAVAPSRGVGDETADGGKQSLSRATVPLLRVVASQHEQGKAPLQHIQQVVPRRTYPPHVGLCRDAEGVQRARATFAANHAVRAQYGTRVLVSEVRTMHSRAWTAPYRATRGKIWSPRLIDHPGDRGAIDSNAKEVGDSHQIAVHELARAIERVDEDDHTMRFHSTQL
mmetsp:Transcript_54334/g.151311  ORF Transcript_54334/g.151311 Transcript_54334/m.151311 type:complete len:256 (+) Transcript_54334:1-768(+)